ncbi:MAG: FAD-binding oxidoreductase [Fimbriimonadaceae bacterium]
MRFDVAVAGGGVVGWSVAWHLLRRDRSLSVAVFDHAPARGAWNHAVGGIRTLFESPYHVAMSLYSRKALIRASAELGAVLDLRPNGHLVVAASDDRAAWLESMVGTWDGLGVDVRRVTSGQAFELCPVLNVSDLAFAVFSPGDAIYRAPRVRDAFRRAARALGAREVAEEVVGFAEGVVLTSVGGHAARHLVVATGHLSRDLSAELNLDLPIRAEPHQVVELPRSRRLPIHAPLTIDADTSLHFRPVEDGAVASFYDRDLELSPSRSAVRPSFDPHAGERLRVLAAHRAPGLVPEGFLTGRNGFYAVTPDRHGIIDRVGDVFVATGFGGNGVMHAPAVGQAVSELFFGGECRTFDLRPFRIGRFAEGGSLSEGFVY